MTQGATVIENQEVKGNGLVESQTYKILVSDLLRDISSGVGYEQVVKEVQDLITCMSNCLRSFGSSSDAYQIARQEITSLIKEVETSIWVRIRKNPEHEEKLFTECLPYFPNLKFRLELSKI